MQNATVVIETKVVLNGSDGVSDVQLTQDALLQLQQQLDEGEVGLEDVVYISRFMDDESLDNLKRRIALQRMHLFIRQARLLQEAWHSCLDIGYPFDKSFDEIVCGFNDVCDSMTAWEEQANTKVG